MNTTEMEPDHCPHCQERLDRASSRTKNPSPGDASICIFCIEVSIFDEKLKLRLPNEEELEAIAHHPEIQRLQTAMQNNPFVKRH